MQHSQAVRPTPPLLSADHALFLDVDGTLLGFAVDPDAVVLPAGALETIGQVSDRLGGALALVSGRPLIDLDRLFAPRQFPAAGLHGQQFRGLSEMPTARSGERLAPLKQAAEAFAASHPGVLVEDKGANIALHWRAAPAAEAGIWALATQAIASIAGYRLQPGDHVVEVVPTDVDKGRALAALMQETPFRGRIPVFVGDDHTDEFGFAAANRLGGFSILVGDRAPSDATHHLRDPDAVHEWLRANAAIPTVPPSTISPPKDPL